MSYLKTLNSTDVIVTPFRVNKGFSFSGDSELTASDVGIDRFLGTKDTGSIFYSSIFIESIMRY